MEPSTLLFVAAVVVLISIWWSRKCMVVARNPLPGPLGLPIVGYLPFLTRKPHIKFQELAKVYGPIYRIAMGSQNVVLLCDLSSMKEAFEQDAFMGRPPDHHFSMDKVTIRTGALHGMPWKEQKRFSMHMLRDLGFGKTKMEEHIKEEILELLERLEETEGKPVKTREVLYPSMSNNIASLIFGKRLKYSDPQKIKLDKILSEAVRLGTSIFWQLFFPWLRTIIGFLRIGNAAAFLIKLRELKEYCRRELEEHEATLDPNNVRDYMDGYLLEIQKKKNDPDSSFKKEVLLDLARTFFGVGSETVRLTVEWILLVCAGYPEVQAKIQAEIDEVMGRERFPTRADHVNMPYTEACILELLRWKTITPLGVPRYTLKDTEVKGYFIPKHSVVFSLLWALDHGEELWGNDVDIYKPERLLSEDGKTVVKPEHFIPFSIGKRSCPGKSLAEVEVFLYVTAILQRFKLSIASGHKPDFEPAQGTGLEPKEQDISFKLR